MKAQSKPGRAKKGEVLTAAEEKSRRKAEVESFLGDAVRTPSGIPDGYTPTDRSVHPLFHVELSDLTYAGPLDLLLYLVKRHEMDILDIPIAKLTDAYLSMLARFEALEIDLAAEFLVLASELIHIKSKMLLPADEGVPVASSDAEEEEKDPRAELIRRLLNYQKYRDAAFQLNDRDQLGRDIFARVPPNLDHMGELVDPGLRPLSVFRLVEAMAKMLDSLPEHHEVSLETYDLSERIQYIRAYGEAMGGRFTLLSLMETTASKSELVVTFIALLEMVKMGLVTVSVPLQNQETGAEFAESRPGAETPEQETGMVGATLQASVCSDPKDRPQGRWEDRPDGSNRSEDHQVGDPDGHQGLKAEIAGLEAIAQQAEAEVSVGESAVSFPLPASKPQPALEPVPEIWVALTDKRFVGTVDDDYRS